MHSYQINALVSIAIECGLDSFTDSSFLLFFCSFVGVQGMEGGSLLADCFFAVLSSLSFELRPCGVHLVQFFGCGMARGRVCLKSMEYLPVAT